MFSNTSWYWHALCHHQQGQWDTEATTFLLRLTAVATTLLLLSCRQEGLCWSMVCLDSLQLHMRCWLQKQDLHPCHRTPEWRHLPVGGWPD